MKTSLMIFFLGQIILIFRENTSKNYSIIKTSIVRTLKRNSLNIYTFKIAFLCFLTLCTFFSITKIKWLHIYNGELLHGKHKLANKMMTMHKLFTLACVTPACPRSFNLKKNSVFQKKISFSNRIKQINDFNDFKT